MKGEEETAMRSFFLCAARPPGFTLGRTYVDTTNSATAGSTATVDARLDVLPAA